MLIIFSIVSSLLFYEDNKEFFNEVHKQTSNDPDLEWNYVGKQKPNPNAKSLILDGGNGEPYILYRLTKGK